MTTLHDLQSDASLTDCIHENNLNDAAQCLQPAGQAYCRIFCQCALIIGNSWRDLIY